MSLANVYSLYRTMEDENVILSFKGVVTADLLTSVLQIMEAKMDALNEPPRIRKKVINVLVECLQNLYHHVEESPEPASNHHLERKSAMVLIAKEKDYFIVKTGNYIANDKAHELNDRLEFINTMDKDGLKEFYQKSLNSRFLQIF